MKSTRIWRVVLAFWLVVALSLTPILVQRADWCSSGESNLSV